MRAILEIFHYTQNDFFHVGGKIISLRTENSLELTIELISYLIYLSVWHVLDWIQPKELKETEAWQGDRHLSFY